MQVYLFLNNYLFFLSFLNYFSHPSQPVPFSPSSYHFFSIFYSFDPFPSFFCDIWLFPLDFLQQWCCGALKIAKNLLESSKKPTQDDTTTFDNIYIQCCATGKGYSFVLYLETSYVSYPHAFLMWQQESQSETMKTIWFHSSTWNHMLSKSSQPLPGTNGLNYEIPSINTLSVNSSMQNLACINVSLHISLWQHQIRSSYSFVTTVLSGDETCLWVTICVVSNCLNKHMESFRLQSLFNLFSTTDKNAKSSHLL